MSRTGTHAPATRCAGPLRRREFLRVGLAGLGGLTLPQLFQLRANAGASPRSERKAVIIVWLIGGASHLETYDPKPGSPSEYRGPFSPIRTTVPGLDICELLPLHARIADRFTLSRSMVHTGFCHQQGAQQLLTGHPVRELKNKPDDPDLFSITHWLRSDRSRGLPNYVGVNPIPYIGSVFILGPSYEPFSVTGDPNEPQFQVPNIGLSDQAVIRRLTERIGLRKGFDRLQRDVERLGEMQALDEFESQALNLLTSPQTRHAFDISQEDPKLRERYGRNAWGQQCLMASPLGRGWACTDHNHVLRTFMRTRSQLGRPCRQSQRVRRDEAPCPGVRSGCIDFNRRFARAGTGQASAGHCHGRIREDPQDFVSAQQR